MREVSLFDKTRGFVDNPVVGGATFQGYLDVQEAILRDLHDMHWLVSPFMAKFGYTWVEVLGHMVSRK